MAGLLVLAASTAEAQEPINIDAMRQSMASDSNVTGLRRREAALARVNNPSVDADLERGMLLIRLYELRGNDADATAARNAFERAVKRAPRDPRGHYGYGLAHSVGAGVRIPLPILRGFALTQSVGELVKQDPASRAKRSFKRALELDPSHAGAAIGLAQLSLDSRDKDNLKAAAHALQNMLERKVGGAAVPIALSEVQAALGNVEAATSAAGAATALEATSSGALRAQAAALLRQSGKYEEGAHAYFAGVETLTAEAAAQYYEDVLPITTERERAQWASASNDFRKQWLQQFWNLRAAAGGVTVAERMAEHYQRLAAAHERYRRTGKRGAAPGGSLVQSKFDSDALPFDERGLILVRHGEPKEIVRTIDVDLRPNETWVYLDRPTNRLYNFVKLRDGPDFRLVDDVLLALDPSTRGIPAEAAVKLLTDRQEYDPRYAALAAKFSAVTSMSRQNTIASSMADAGQRRQQLAQEMRKLALAALETDSDQPDFTGDLPFYYDLYSFKGDRSLTTLTAAAAIPGTSVSANQVGTHFLYSLQASLILIDTATNTVSRKDTVLTFRSGRMLGVNEHLRLHIDLPARYSQTSIHRIVIKDLVTPGKGQLYGGDADIKNFDSDKLMLSDIVLAEPDNGSWTRGDVKLGLVPPRQFREGQPLRLFYEIYNLPAESSYRTEIVMENVEGQTGFGRIKRLFGAGGSGGVRVQFDGVAPRTANSIIQEMRQVTAQVKPGKYRVTVRITNLANQQTVRSETIFLVMKP